MIHFEIPKNQSSILKVIGVGGGGSNAVNYMYNLGLDGVDFLVCNTDQQALALSPVPNKIQLGPHLTQGLGAGANPEIGKQAGEESTEEINKILKVNTRMAFITAGMGGGTGTGGAPVVAKICRDLGILTVGIVTTPFTYEGRKRMKQAQEGIDRLREHVDTILIISNDKLRHQFGNLPFTQAFAKADNVLATAAKCITDVITTSGQVNVDFADVTTVMKNGGVAILGNATASGDNRALKAVEEAISSPLLNDNDIRGAKWILLNVTSSEGTHEHTLDELDEIQAYVQQMAGDNCDLIMGVGHDPSLGEDIGVTVIATGFNHTEINTDFPLRPAIATAQPERIIMKLDDMGDAPVSPAPERSEAETRAESLQPRLVESFNPQPAFPTLKPLPINDAPRPAFPTTTYEDRQMMTLQMDSVEEPAAAEKEESAEPEVPVFQIHLKEEVPAETPSAFKGVTLTPEELEEKRRFEEQKKQLEDRAERLRKLSFNIKGSEGADDMENVPAYVRRNMNVEEPGGLRSQDSFYSGYSVGVDAQNGNNQGSIQTINTFLHGNKPD